MEDSHKLIIQKNYLDLINKTNINQLLPRLIEKGVFSERIAEPYQNYHTPEIERKRQLYLSIQRRGPHAFVNLIDALKEIGDFDHLVLASLLEGKEITVHHQNNEKHHQKLPPLRHCNHHNINKIESVIEEEVDDNHRVPVGSGTVPFMVTEGQRPNHLRQLSQEMPHASISLSDEPIKINVRKSERFYDDPRESKVPIYRMRSKCRGVYLGINNMEFVNDVMSYRTGAHVDEENLKDLFKQFGFKTNNFRNQTKMDMLRTLKHFADVEKTPELRQADCLVVAIMSHGEEGEAKESSQVATSDGKSLPVTWILDQFSNSNCPALQGKPKIFIFQICRGNNLHPGVKVHRRIETDGVMTNQGHIVREMTDFLIAFSTLPGDRSYRDIHLGTWYVQLICEVFMRHAYDTDVEHLLKMVDEHLAKLRSEDGNMQTSTYESRGFKRCYLHPGLSE